MNILIKKKKTELVTPETVNFTELVKSSNTTNSLNIQSKIVELLNTEFTEPQQKLYVANLWMYTNYHPTNDFPISLEDVFKEIGFANKGNAKKTLENNFVLNEDYKIIHNLGDERLLVRTEKQTNQTQNNRGGHNCERIVMNTDTLKSLCMIAKTPQGKDMRKYYVKLENINNKVVSFQMEEQKQLLIEQNKELKHKDTKIMEMSRRKLVKYDKLQSVYIGTDNIDRSKIGSTKDQNSRQSTYKVNNPDFKIKYIIPCNDYLLIERIIKHILKKHTLDNYNEWFNISCDKLKVILETIIYIIDDTMKFELDDIYNIFARLHEINSNPEKVIQNEEVPVEEVVVEEEVEEVEEEIINKHFAYSLYQNFINNDCEIGPKYRESGEDLMIAFKNSLQDTENKEKINDFYNKEIYSRKTYNFLFSFKCEFYDNISKILKTDAIDYQFVNNKLEKIYARGFNGIRVKNKKVDNIIDVNVYDCFFNNKLEKTNEKLDKIKTSELLKYFDEYIKSENIQIDRKLIDGTDFIKCYGYNHHFKDEFLEMLTNRYSIKEQRIRFNIPNCQKTNRGFYFLKKIVV
jgi:phage anti-repressor protein